MTHSAEEDAPDLTDAEVLVGIHNRNGGGWGGFHAIARAIRDTCVTPPGVGQS